MTPTAEPEPRRGLPATVSYHRPILSAVPRALPTAPNSPPWLTRCWETPDCATIERSPFYFPCPDLVRPSPSARPVGGCAAISRARDLAGVRDLSIPRARPFRLARLGRALRTMVRCTARAAGARIVSCSARARRARQMRWAGAHRTSRCRPQSRTPSLQPSRTAPPWTRSWRGSVRATATVRL